jgi:hypothetical protein
MIPRIFQALLMVLSYLFKSISTLLSGHGLGRNAFLAKAYLKVAKFLLPDVIDFRGNKICLESPDAMKLAVFGRYSEEYELSLFESMIDSSSVVLDIGANIGLYTITAARTGHENLPSLILLISQA